MDLPASVPGIAIKKPIDNFTHLKTGQQLSQGRQVKCSTFFVVLRKLLACFLSHLPNFSDKFLQKSINRKQTMLWNNTQHCFFQFIAMSRSFSLKVVYPNVIHL